MSIFVNLVRADICCPPENIQLTAGPTLYCNQCQKNCFNVYEYITKPSTDHFRSSELARAFFEWTRDENVPMNFTLIDIEGIFPKTIVGQSLNRVHKSLQLLKALNAPFTTRPFVDSFLKDVKDTFLIDFLNIIYEHPNAESTHSRMILDTLIKAMHDLLSSKEVAATNLFETYFNVLVPHVQQCLSEWQPLNVNDSHENLALELLMHFQISSMIRKEFGKFSIAFDVIHVMVACFACSVDMDVVGNFVLDFMARICRGRFFWKEYPECPFVKSMNRLLEREIVRRKQAVFYNTLRAIRNGESAEHYSTFLKPFQEVQMFLKRKFDGGEMAFIQTFPAVCFPDHADYLGFTMGHNYLIQTIHKNNGREPKGIYKTAKTIHQTVQKFVDKIRQFEEETPNDSRGNVEKMQWTMDTFKLFLASDPDYEKEILKTVETLMIDNQDGN